MSKFSLSRKKGKTLPDAVTVDGSVYPVDSDFRNILRILRMLSDDSVVEAQRPVLLAKWFYKDSLPSDFYNVFSAFLYGFREIKESLDDRPKKEEPPRFDFEFDAEEIYTSFFEQYGINLISIDFLHWYEFVMLLGGLGENTAFQRKIHLRFYDLKGLKGEALTKAKRAKTAVQIPDKRSRAVTDEMRRIEAALLGDGDLTGVL